MANNSQLIGFVALWHNKASEYHAGPEEAQETIARIQRAFDDAHTRNVRMFGQYGCRWSTERQYLTFWTCPSLLHLEATMDALERVGDFKFADSEHIIGIRVPDAEMTDEEYLAAGEPHLGCPVALFVMWRRTDAYYRATPEVQTAYARSVRQVLRFTRNQGVRLLGRYDCRWSTGWDFFTFWLAPSLTTIEATIHQLERAGHYQFADSRYVIGNWEPRFRFGRHLQFFEDRPGHKGYGQVEKW
jgi:hypothetical protein